MPIYEYECCVCDHHFEQRQSFSDEPVADCPRCRSKARRVIRSAPVIFKGSGFYVTDNRKPGSLDKSEDTAKEKSKDTVKEKSK